MKAIVAFLFFCLLTSQAPAALLMYDGFEYPTTAIAPGANNGNFPGNTNAAYGGTWTVAFAPTGGLSPSTQQNVVAGAVEYPHPSQQPSPGGRLQVNRAAAGKNLATAINIPGGPISSGSVFFSFTMQVNSWTNLAASGSRSGSNWWGGMVAGLHGLPEGGNMSPTTNFGTQVRVLRYVDPDQNGTTTPNQAQRFHLGVVKNSPGSGTSWHGATTNGTSAQDTADLSTTFGLNERIFVVGEYKFVDGDANDETRIWINPAPGDFSQYLNPTVPVVNALSTVPDPTAGQIASFFFFSDTQTAGNILFDELRIGTQFQDVVPIPEPTTIAMCGAGLVVLLAGARRKR